jgi:hypothetical protein
MSAAMQPKAKKQRVLDPTLTLLQSLISNGTPIDVETERSTPLEIAEKELEYYLNIPQDQWPNFSETLTWWQSRQISTNLPCLSQVATALLACNPSSGGLECDFSLWKDVIKPKRTALGQGFVEVEMMLKMNKHLFHSNPDKVIRLPNDKWKEYIPAWQTYEALGDLDDDDEETTVTSVEDITMSVQNM